MENIIYTIPMSEFEELIRKCIREEMATIKPAKTEEKLIKIEDAIKLLGVSKVTLYKWREKGLIPYQRISSRIYFDKAQLMESIKTSKKTNKK